MMRDFNDRKWLLVRRSHPSNDAYNPRVRADVALLPQGHLGPGNGHRTSGTKVKFCCEELGTVWRCIRHDNR
jgi:hypothetical protein